MTAATAAHQADFRVTISSPGDRHGPQTPKGNWDHPGQFPCIHLCAGTSQAASKAWGAPESGGEILWKIKSPDASQAVPSSENGSELRH